MKQVLKMLGIVALVLGLAIVPASAAFKETAQVHHKVSEKITNTVTDAVTGKMHRTVQGEVEPVMKKAKTKATLVKNVIEPNTKSSDDDQSTQGASTTSFLLWTTTE